MATQKEKVGTVEVMGSSKRPYVITRYSDGSWYCGCPAWRFQKIPAEQRTCKHIEQVKKLLGVEK